MKIDMKDKKHKGTFKTIIRMMKFFRDQAIVSHSALIPILLDINISD